MNTNTATPAYHPSVQFVQTSDKDKARFHDVIKGSDTAMLVTHCGEGGPIRARPMALASLEDNCDTWFVTDGSEGKVAEIQQFPDVCVTIQKGATFISMSGRAFIHHEREKIHELWRDSWKTYFPKGRDSPEIALIKIEPTIGEMWDNSGVKGIKFMIEMAKARMQHRTPADMDHAKVDLHHSSMPMKM
ncbi:general stress protein [Capsaspora owczarzaki ATCC 30864]|uniref:General stress protein n=1 Tax=Capsaspora owczarzaki (strain ATCC 30864) TaxID=595528 RepID=A0A0D2WT93_CAPO3|nr:general stress protein [Capsaspora owczarzaki ATCC 30864]KJE94838.1 general stress protein [Capsaspora owczarzaki ATCC 30864]|eukprot:XP_004346082.1 general stress protein [Capsaspora owczarzaki ATCC 30864]